MQGSMNNTHTGHIQNRVYDIYSYRNIYNVSRFKFKTDTRLPRYSSSCFYCQKPGGKPKAGRQGVLYNNTLNAVIFNLGTCAKL